MVTKNLSACLIISLFSFFVSAEITQQSSYALKDSFNVKQYWHEGMTWDEFNAIKVPLAHNDYIAYVDKIDAQKIAKAHGIAVPKTYFATRSKKPVAPLLSKLPSYVAKMTHLSWSDGLIIVINGINMMTGKPITPQEVEESLHASLDTKPRDNQTWALFNCKPGFMIQEYIAKRNEVKIQTIFGKVILGLWFKGETDKALAPLQGVYDREGNPVRDSHDAPEWWHRAVASAELLAQGTDSLRVDFLIREDGTLLMNELEYFPEIYWRPHEKSMLMKAVNEGYKAIS